MLSVYCLVPAGLKRLERDPGAPLPEDAVWLDLLEPTVEEERLVEQRLGLDIPTREEMREIESSARLYEEAGALYLTATVVTRLDTQQPETSPEQRTDARLGKRRPILREGAAGNRSPGTEKQSLYERQRLDLLQILHLDLLAQAGDVHHDGGTVESIEQKLVRA